jgi:hypothetical protein
MKKITLIFILLLFSEVINAKPIYLNCEIKNSPEDINFSLKIDESNGKITHTFADNRAFNAEGFFSEESISYKSIKPVSTSITTINYSINRSTLAIEKQVKFGADQYVPEFNSSVMTGQCEIVKATKTKRNKI